MKKQFIILLVICLLLSLAACGNDVPDHTDPEETTDTSAGEITELTLASIAGWWTKPEGFEGLTILYTFSVDAENGILTSYDDYGNAIDTYACWCDRNGFSIDAGEIFGVSTYTFDGERLSDEDGNVHYVRCAPIDPNDAPYTMSDLIGAWYQNGNDAVYAVFDESGYRMETVGFVTENGTALATKHTTYYDASKYSGPAVSLENESGFSSTLWILDNGQTLYDDFRKNYYLRSSLTEEAYARLEEKYALIRDDWYTDGEDMRALVFSFYGELWLRSSDGNGTWTTEVIGNWDLRGDTVYLSYADGSTQEIDLSAENVVSDYCNQTFIRHAYW